METFIYVLIGIVSAAFTYSVGFSVIGVLKGNKRQKELEDRIFQVELNLGTLDRDVHERIDITEMRIDRDIENTHQTFRDVEVDLRSQLDSRLDKLTNQIIKKIPPTNEELVKRIDKIEEESYRLRMNL